MNKQKILLSFTAIVGAAVILVAAAFALFTDTETSASNTFVAGVLDLKIDNESYYNGQVSSATTWELDDLDGHLFFDFRDVKPGDWGEDTISLHVNDNDAWACLDINLTSNDDNQTNDLEIADTDVPDNPDLFDGELAQNLNFIFWADDGDNVLEEDEESSIFLQGPATEVLNDAATLADSILSNIGGVADGDPLPGGETRYIAKAWCFGEMTLTPVAPGENSPLTNPGFTCDGSGLDNITQTDIVTADLAFAAIQSRNNDDFVCNQVGGGPTPTPTVEPTPSTTPIPSPTPPLIACTTNDNIFASSSNDNDQGLRKDSTPVLANRSIPSAAFGPPQTSGASSDVGFPVGSFFSLGFPLGGNTASIVFGFAEPFYPNPSGADLQIFEVTGGVYPDEKVKVEASTASTGPWTQLAASAIRDEDIELGILESAQFVRLTDVSTIADFPNDADGYDVDALKAFCTEANLQ